MDRFYVSKVLRDQTALGIADILSSIRKYLKCYNLIKFSTVFTSQLSKNYNYICQDSFILSISEQYTSPKKFYPLLCLPPLTHNPAPLKTLLYIMNTPPLLTCINLLLLNMSLTLQSKPCLKSPNNTLTKYMTNLTKMIQTSTKNMKNWFISNRRNFALQRIPRCSKKQQPSFHQKLLNKRIIYIHLPHTLKNALRR